MDNGNATTDSAMSRDGQCLIATRTESTGGGDIIFLNPGLCENAQIQVIKGQLKLDILCFVNHRPAS